MDISYVVDVKSVLENPEFLDNDLIKLFTYPNIDLKLSLERLAELFEMGIEKIILDGETQIGKYRVVGKGTNSIVLKGILKEIIVIIKILRLDASRKSLEQEASIIKRILTNSHDIKIVPNLFEYRPWALILEYIEGIDLYDFFQEEVYNLDKASLSEIFYKIAYKAFLLDKIGVDHGELSKPKSHIILEEPNYEPIFIDFESASMKRTPRNFSSVIQALFIRNPASQYLAELFEVDLAKIRKYVSIYNKSRDESTVKYILSKIFNLQ